MSDTTNIIGACELCRECGEVAAKDAEIERLKSEVSQREAEIARLIRRCEQAGDTIELLTNRAAHDRDLAETRKEEAIKARQEADELRKELAVKPTPPPAESAAVDFGADDLEPGQKRPSKCGRFLIGIHPKDKRMFAECLRGCGSSYWNGDFATVSAWATSHAKTCKKCGEAKP